MSSETVDLARILRLRAMLESLRSEVRELTPDEASLQRLAAVHNTIESELAEALTDELKSELAEFSSCCHDNHTPSKSEIRVAQAQLMGWIEGLLQGVQLSLANHPATATQPTPAPQPELGRAHDDSAYL